MRKPFSVLQIILLIATAFLVGALLIPTAATAADEPLTAAEARTIAKEAFLWGMHQIMYKLTFTTLLITFALSPLASADNWQPLTGADPLQSLVSGATAEIELKPTKRGRTAFSRFTVGWSENVRTFLLLAQLRNQSGLERLLLCKS